jgi:FtsH-binding integral membrane protein
MSERLQDLKPTWIAFGWFIAVAVMGLIMLTLVSVDVIRPDTPAEQIWTAAAIAIGFVAGGALAGYRAGTAPILHGLLLGLFSVVIWVLANLFLGEPLGQTAWGGLAFEAAAGLLLLQTVAALVGARIGVRLRRSAPAG